ncbi:hypothetical protein, partial [Mycobacterium colombiense]
MPAPPGGLVLGDQHGTGLGWRKLDVVEQTGSTNADLLAR